MTATLMCAADRAELDGDWPAQGRVFGIARQLGSEAWLLIAEAYQPGATVQARTELLVNVAGRYVDLVDTDDLAVLAAVALPHLIPAQRASVVADVADWLEQAQRFADVSEPADLAELLDGPAGANWVDTAEVALAVGVEGTVWQLFNGPQLDQLFLTIRPVGGAS